MNELQLQRELVSETIKIGGFGFKANNRFLIGVADLHLIVDHKPLWLEIKYFNRLPRGRIVNIGLTPHQRRFLKNIQAAGGHAAWLVAVKHDRVFLVDVGTDADRDQIIFHNPVPSFLGKHFGQPWPIRDIVHAATSGEW